MSNYIQLSESMRAKIEQVQSVSKATQGGGGGPKGSNYREFYMRKKNPDQRVQFKSDPEIMVNGPFPKQNKYKAIRVVKNDINISKGRIPVSKLKKKTLNELNNDLEDVLHTRISSDTTDRYEYNPNSDELDYVDLDSDHAFIDYIEMSSPRVNQAASRRARMISDPSDDLIEENEYLRKKIELLKMENSNMHSKIRFLETKLFKRVPWLFSL